MNRAFRSLSSMVCHSALLAWGCVSASGAGPFPDLVVPAGVGLNVHFSRGHEADLDRIAAAGVRWIRMDLGWGGIERQRGQYDWAAYDELTANLQRRGLSAIYILDYSNPLYEEAVTARNPVTGDQQTDIASPQHPASVAAFAEWAAAAARHFRGRPVIWEVWNEPNITFWKPKPDVRQYAELALATCHAVRAADPRAVIIAPATSEVPLKFLGDFFATGILAQLDGVSVHPYRNYRMPPETVLDDYPKVRALIERYAPAAKRRLPIISGEWGYASHTKGVSPETQAAFLVRQQLVNLLAGVPISIWYDWKNDGPDPAEREHNFGIVAQDLQPKPAYHALQAMTGALAGSRLVRRLATGATDDFALLFADRQAGLRLAAWTAGGPHEIALPVKTSRESRAEAITSQGNRFGVVQELAGSGGVASSTSAAAGDSAIALSRDQLRLRLTLAPVYVTLHGIKPR